MNHLLIYNSLTQAANATLTDTPAVTDPSFSIRNGHFILTENYSISAIASLGANMTAAQLNIPTFNYVNIPQLYPPNLSATPPSNPQVMDLRGSPVALPVNEELAVQTSNAGNGTCKQSVVLFIRPAGDSAPMQPSTLANPRVQALVTANVTLTAGAWSPDAQISMSNPLKGGTYMVNGAYWVIANALCYRMNFLKPILYNGVRKLFPGGLVENAYGNIPLMKGDSWLGTFCQFNNFELPLLSVFGITTTGATVYTGYLDMTYLGPSATP